MPQPFHGVTQEVGSLEQRPRLAQHVGIIAALWAEVETRLTVLLAAILRADAHIAMAMYMPVRSEAARLSIIEAAASERLTPKMFTEYMALKKRVKNTGDERDTVVHGLWAVPEDNPRTIVLLDHKTVLEGFTFVVSEIAKKFDKGNKRDIKTSRKVAKKVRAIAAKAKNLEYSAKDFIQIEKNIRKRLREISSFHTKVFRQSHRRRKAPPPPKSPNPTP